MLKPALPESLPRREKKTRKVAPHLRLGSQGEDVAANALVADGYTILARNWRYGHLELDLVCEKDGWVIFVEVKTRRTAAHGGPSGAMTKNKRRRLWGAAQAWLNIYGMWEKPGRFDVICLVGDSGNFRMEHYRDAFEFSNPLDSRHSNWQPW